MIKRTFLIWAMILTFGLTSMPVIGFSAESKQTGNTELTKKKKPKKNSKKTKKKYKKKKNSRNLKSGGKNNLTKKVKYSKNKKYSGKKKYSKKKKSSKRYKNSYKRKYYAPPTNSSNVEYRTYKRNSESSNGVEMNIEKIAPSKEIRKEPKKEGEN